MGRERIFGLSGAEQLMVGAAGSLGGILLAGVDKIILESQLCKSSQVISVPSENPTYTCSPGVKAAELGAGSAIIVTAIFAAAAIASRIKQNKQ